MTKPIGPIARPKRDLGGQSVHDAHERAQRYVPQGAHTYSKDDAHFPPNAPRFINGGFGATVWDDKGNDWLDWGMGLRSVILGHAYPEVVNAAIRALGCGANHTRPTYLEGELAERLCSLIPAGQNGGMAKMGKNGSDATTAAVRLARAATGRSKILVCDGSFHASDDWWLSTQPLRAGTFEQGTRVFPYNDRATLINALPSREYAAVIMEPMAFEWPNPDYLEEVRDWCRAYGTVLIFDEVISGFRFGLGGAQAYFGVTPDLACFGKGIANGFAVSALVGSRALMETPGVHLLSSTHGGDTHDLAAAIATIEVLEREDVPAHLARIGTLLQVGLQNAGYDVRGHPASPNVQWPSDKRWPARDYSHGPSWLPARVQPVRDGHERMAFAEKMCARGILAPYFAPSFSHTEKDVERTVEAAQP